MIEGVVIKALSVIEDKRGAVLHMTKAGGENSIKFGEIYFSEINANIIKGWKLHKKITQHVCVPVGRVQFVLYDDRESSATKGEIHEFVLGRPEFYNLVHIPPGIWYSFSSVVDGASIVANVIDYPYDQRESETLDIADNYIPYKWQE